MVDLRALHHTLLSGLGARELRGPCGNGAADDPTLRRAVRVPLLPVLGGSREGAIRAIFPYLIGIDPLVPAGFRFWPLYMVIDARG